MDCGTQKLDIVSDTGVLRKKALFYGRVEAYFAVYDSVVLTGPLCAGPPGAQAPLAGRAARLTPRAVEKAVDMSYTLRLWHIASRSGVATTASLG